MLLGLSIHHQIIFEHIFFEEIIQRDFEKRERDIEMEKVCVTGAGGYVASWVIKDLLSKGYIVHGTVRDPSDEKKNGHLWRLEHAKERLHLFKADLLDHEGLCAAIEGCTGVLHVASPVPAGDVANPEAEVIEPAVTGTKNVLSACLKAKVKKVVVVSSILAVLINPSWPHDQPKDESCWTDAELCKKIQKWYCVAKTVAEREAVEFAKINHLNLITICPSIVIGPMLQPTLNTSTDFLLKFLKGGEKRDDNIIPLIDVRDLSDGLILLYEKPEAEGRYICSSHLLNASVLVEKLKSLFPHYNNPSFTDVKEDAKFSCQKMLDLGWKYRPLEDTLVDAVKNYEDAGFLSKV